MREIQERREFLDEMRRLGSSQYRQVKVMVETEIADKTNELQELRLQDNEMNLSFEDDNYSNDE